MNSFLPCKDGIMADRVHSRCPLTSRREGEVLNGSALGDMSGFFDSEEFAPVRYPPETKLHFATAHLVIYQTWCAFQPYFMAY